MLELERQISSSRPRDLELEISTSSSRSRDLETSRSRARARDLETSCCRAVGCKRGVRATPRHFDYLYSIGFTSRGCQGSAWILCGDKYPETCRRNRRRRRAMVGHTATFRGVASIFFNTSRDIWPRRASKRTLWIPGTQIRSSIDSRNDEVWIPMPRRGQARARKCHGFPGKWHVFSSILGGNH